MTSGMSPTKFRIATDCSGTDAPLFAVCSADAVRDGRIRVSHRWSSDTCPAAKQFIAMNHKPKVWYDDACERDERCLSRVDCLAVGLPCQPFSAMGLRRGFNDKRMRVCRSFLRTLKHGRVRSFIYDGLRLIPPACLGCGSESSGMLLGVSSENSRGPPGGSCNAYWEFLGYLLGGLLRLLGGPFGGPSWKPLRPSWGPLGPFWGPRGNRVGRLEGPLVPSWSVGEPKNAQTLQTPTANQ